MRAVLCYTVLCASAFATDAISIAGQVTMTGQHQMVSGSFESPGKAVVTSHIDGQTGAGLTEPIEYLNGGGATSFKVYLDASETAITPTTLVQDSAATSYVPTLAYSTKYWCRVDSANSTGTTTGDVFSFDSMVPLSVDFMLDFEGMTVGTPAAADFATARTVSDASGSWPDFVISSFASGDVAIAASNMDMRTDAEIDAEYFTGAGSRSLVIAQEKENVYLDQVFPTGNWAQVDVSGVISIGTIGSTFCTLDVVFLGNTEGGFFVFQTNATFKAQAHGDYPGTSQTSASTSTPDNSAINPDGGTLSLTPDTVYQFRMNAIKAGICTLKIYNETGETLLRTLKIDLTSTEKDAYWNRLRIGRTDAHGDSAVANMRFDNVRVRLSTTTTPEIVSGP